MSVLIIYESLEGQTRKIAGFAQETARGAGHAAALFDAADKTAPLDLEGVTHVVLAAPVHERRHPAEFELLLGTTAEALRARRTLLLSVSLSAAFEEGLDEAQDYVDEMKMRTGFEPDAEALVAGAVKTGSYDYFATQVVRHVVLRDRDYDPGEGEHEFTDWPALEAALTRFLGSAPKDTARAEGSTVS